MINTEEVIIAPGGGSAAYFKDLWRFRSLFLALAWRDVLVRYKQALLGAAWAVLRPVLTVMVFAFVFGRIAALPSGGVNYTAFVLVTMLPWMFFSGSFSEMANSLIQNENLVSKVYFPRVLVPLSALLVNATDLAVAIGLMGPWLLTGGGAVLGLRLLAVPALLFLTAFSTVGLGLWFAALNVRYRDFRYVVPFVVQFGLFITPVGYSADIVPAGMRTVYALNPMVGVCQGLRWALFNLATPHLGTDLLLSIFVSLVLGFSGWLYFRSVESTFADRI